MKSVVLMSLVTPLAAAPPVPQTLPDSGRTAAAPSPTLRPSTPAGLVGGGLDVPTCLRQLRPGETCPDNLRVPPDRTAPVVAAATAILLTGAGVTAAALAALVRRLRRRRTPRPPR